MYFIMYLQIIRNVLLFSWTFVKSDLVLIDTIITLVASATESIFIE